VPRINEYKAKFDFVWVTRPWPEVCEDWEKARRRWLMKHFGATTDNIIFTGRKELIDGDVFIDDHDKNIFAWQTEYPSGLALLMQAKYNEHITSIPRYTWNDLSADNIEKMYFHKQLQEKRDNE
jgi:5'(3')-deoxyribonucleotidase